MAFPPRGPLDNRLLRPDHVIPADDPHGMKRAAESLDPRPADVLQPAPAPAPWVFTYHVLGELVSKVTCKPGWSFAMFTEDGALRLVISVTGPDAADPEREMTVRHFFPVPSASYNAATWRRWIFDRCRCVENHELGEWFRLDGERPFAPLHGPGEDPYTVHEFRDDVDRRTSQWGTVRPA